MSDIEESDWKLLRRLKPVALERLCQRVVHEVGRTCDWDSRTYHQRFLQAFSLIQRGNEDLASAFDDLRRSNALMRLAIMKERGLLTQDEFSRFSEETQNRIRTLERATTPDHRLRSARASEESDSARD